MSLQDWSRMGQVIEHTPTIAEVRNLISVVDRELADAGISGLSDDGRFTHAYDAALILCKLALHVTGFELQKRVPGHHALWINSLEFTLGGGNVRDVMFHLLKSSKLRHTGLYDHAGVVQKGDADDLLEVARQLRVDMAAWLRSKHAALLPRGF